VQGHEAGARRRAVALQLQVHSIWVEAALQLQKTEKQADKDKFGGNDGSMSRAELRSVMRILCAGGDDDGGGVPDSEVEFVLQLAEHPPSETKIMRTDVRVSKHLCVGAGVTDRAGGICIGGAAAGNMARAARRDGLHSAQL
jgi:hypothetical protein